MKKYYYENGHKLPIKQPKLTEKELQAYFINHCGIKNVSKHFEIKNNCFKSYMYFGKCRKCGTYLLHLYNISKFEYEGKEAIDVFKEKRNLI